MNRRVVLLGGWTLSSAAWLACWTVVCSLTATLFGAPPGSTDPAFTFALPQARVQTMLPLADGRVLVGGHVRAPWGCYGLFVPLYDDGGVSSSFLAKSAPDGRSNCAEVQAIALQADGRMLIGGSFTFYSGLARLGLARVNSDGSPDGNFMPEFEAPVDWWSGSHPEITAIDFQSDGKIVVCGGFTRVNGHAETNLARLFPDGRLDLTFNSSFVPSGFVNQVLVQPDDKILVRGDLSVRRLNPDGTLDERFEQLRPAGTVYQMALQPDGKILLGSGGNLPWLPGSPGALVTRLHSDGSLDRSFFPILNHGVAREFIDDLSLLPDGRIMVGGAFMTTEGAAFTRLARLHQDGTIDGNFTAELTVGPFFQQDAVAVDKNGNILVATAAGMDPSAVPPPLVRLVGGDPAPLPPAIKIQPIQSTFGWGETVLLTTVVAGFPNPMFQWRVDGQDLPGATSSALLITHLAAASRGAYQLSASNSLGAVLSDPVILTVPSITRQPSPQAVPLLAAATFSVQAASALPLAYQWYKDGIPIDGGTNSTLVLNRVQSGDAGNYTVVVRNAMGNVTSTPAALTLLPPRPPEIVFQPLSQTVREGEGAAFSVRSKHYLPVSYQWWYQTQPLPGATLATLTLSQVDRAMAGAYTVVLDSLSGSTTSAPAMLTAIPATVPVILSQPQSQVAAEGGVASFSVTATNYLPLSYQWQHKGADMPGQREPTLRLVNLHLADAGAYGVMVQSEYASVLSEVAVLSITPLPFAERQLTDPSQSSLEEVIASSRIVTFGFDGAIAITNTLVIVRDLTLDAAGRRIILDGQHLVRHFRVSDGATLRLINLTLVSGRFVGPDGREGENGNPGLGGAIYSDFGNVELFRCQFLDNSVAGGNGGAARFVAGFIMTEGAPGYGGAIYLWNATLRATDCLFANNSAKGGHGQSGDVYTARGQDAFGGAIYGGMANTTLIGVTFTNNSANAGEFWGSRPLRGAGQSWGGAVANAGGRTVITNCVFLANRAVGAIKVASDPAETGNANGGAVAQLGGSMWIERTLFRTNIAIGGGGAERGAAATVSAPGNGGAIFVGSGSLGLRESALVSNRADGGPVTSLPPWSASGGAGSGGGIYNAGELSVTNSTLADNSANGGPGLAGFYGQAGGPAYGGGLFLARGSASLVNLTIAGNAVQAGVLGTPEASGASIFAKDGRHTLINSILACLPSQTNVVGTLVDGGHNLSSDASAKFTSGSSRDNTDPLLAPLADNGGPTPTMLLLPGSPGIDAGDNSACPAGDQRGVSRPQSLGCDIGALELSPKLALNRSPDGTVWLEYIFLPHQTNMVSVSTNLLHWLPLGKPVSDQTGYFRIEDPDRQFFPARFFRVQPVE